MNRPRWRCAAGATGVTLSTIALLWSVQFWPPHSMIYLIGGTLPLFWWLIYCKFRGRTP